MILRWALMYWKAVSGENSPARKEILGMASDKIRIKEYLKLVYGVESFGPYGYQMPNNKNLGKGLFELRDTQKHTRFYYCASDWFCFDENGPRSVLFLLHVDTNKDKQAQAIELARKRMKNLKLENILNPEKIRIFKPEGASK